MKSELLWDLGLLFTAEARDAETSLEERRLLAIGVELGERAVQAQMRIERPVFPRLSWFRKRPKELRLSFLKRQSAIWVRAKKRTRPKPKS